MKSDARLAAAGIIPGFHGKLLAENRENPAIDNL